MAIQQKDQVARIAKHHAAIGEQGAMVRRRIAAATTDIADPGEAVQQTTGEQITLANEVTPQEQVTVIIPKDYTLHRDDGTIGHYKAGVQEMGVDDAAHWFSRALGVKVYEKS